MSSCSFASREVGFDTEKPGSCEAPPATTRAFDPRGEASLWVVGRTSNCGANRRKKVTTLRHPPGGRHGKDSSVKTSWTCVCPSSSLSPRRGSSPDRNVPLARPTGQAQAKGRGQFQTTPELNGGRESRTCHDRTGTACS